MRILRTLPQSPVAALFAAVLAAAPAAAQPPVTTQVGGDSVAVYALVANVRVEAAPAGAVELRTVFRGSGANDAYVEASPGHAAVVYPGTRLVAPGIDRAREYTVTSTGAFGTGAAGRRVTVAPAGQGTQAQAEVVISLPPGKRLVVRLAEGRVSVPGAEPLATHGPVATAVISNTGGTLRMRVLRGAAASR